jgi:hypothetical protein
MSSLIPSGHVVVMDCCGLCRRCGDCFLSKKNTRDCVGCATCVNCVRPLDPECPGDATCPTFPEGCECPSNKALKDAYGVLADATAMGGGNVLNFSPDWLLKLISKRFPELEDVESFWMCCDFVRSLMRHSKKCTKECMDLQTITIGDLRARATGINMRKYVCEPAWNSCKSVPYS